MASNAAKSANGFEKSARVVEAEITYVSPNSPINRRFVSPGREHNTGTYGAHKVPIRDGRPFKDLLLLDTHGFQLVDAPSKVTDFFDKEEVDRTYPAEMVELLQNLTGADQVVPLGWMTRSSGDLAQHQRPKEENYSHQGGVQPPAGEAHVDFLPEKAEIFARMAYEKAFPDGPGYSRFLAVSMWRAFSKPPQDMPLAVCDSRSVGDGEGMPNTMFIVDTLPDEAAMLGEMPGEDQAPAAAIFSFSPAHRWWYYSDMQRDEVLIFKFHDSDANRAKRTPHTAFHDTSFKHANERESIEFRLLAYFG